MSVVHLLLLRLFESVSLLGIQLGCLCLAAGMYWLAGYLVVLYKCQILAGCLCPKNTPQSTVEHFRNSLCNKMRFMIDYLSHVFPRSMETQIPVTTQLTTALPFRLCYHKETDLTSLTVRAQRKPRVGKEAGMG
jgi:hypothetical protein